METQVRAAGGGELLGAGAASGETLFSLAWVGVTQGCSLYKHTLKCKTYNFVHFSGCMLYFNKTLILEAIASQRQIPELLGLKRWQRDL